MVSQVQTKAQVMAGKIERVLPKGVVLRDVLVFLGGAETFHTLSHAWLAMSGMLPMDVAGPVSFTITQQVNVIALVVNALITVGLLYWAKQLKKS